MSRQVAYETSKSKTRFLVAAARGLAGLMLVGALLLALIALPASGAAYAVPLGNGIPFPNGTPLENGVAFPNGAPLELDQVLSYKTGPVNTPNTPAAAPEITTAVPEGITGDEWTSIQDQIRQAEYQVTWQTVAGENPAYRAPNRVQGFGVTFAPEGFRASAEEWHFGLKLTGYGDSAMPAAVARQDLSTDQAQVTYRWTDDVREWYINQPQGVKHGLTLFAPPTQRGDEVYLTFALDTDLIPSLSADGQALTLSSPWQTILRYDSLLVTDATGRQLPAHFSLSPFGHLASASISIIIYDKNATYPLTIDPLLYNQVAKLTASDAQANDYFGRSVSISGDVLVVGANREDSGANNAGAAYLFARDQGGTDNWGQVKKLTASDVQADDYFGHPVSISGDVLVIGAWGEDSGGSLAGAAYVFERNQGGADNWGQVKKLTASDAQADDRFGTAVSINGDVLLVGAWGEDTGAGDAGAAYVFVRNQGGADNWGQVRKLTASDAQASDYFGYRMSISGDVLVIGAYGEDSGGSDAGAAYVFERNQGGVDNWGQVKKLTASDAQADDYFGRSVSISGDVLLAGAWGEDSGGSYAGAAYVYARNQGGADNWGQVTKLTASDAQANDRFGISVSISDEVLLIGAHQEDSGGNNAGAAYVYLEPPLGILKSVTPGAVTGGDTVTYTIQLAAASYATVTNVVITDIVPLSLTVQSIVSSGLTITDTGAIPPYVWQVQDLSPGDSGTITLTALVDQDAPGGVVTNTVEYSSSVGSGAAVALLNIEYPNIVVNPRSLGFGERSPDGGPSTAQNVIIRNNALAGEPLNISSVGLTGADADQFTIIGDTGETALPPGSTRTVQVAFDPDSLGAKSANLTIISDDEDEGAIGVALSGTGITVQVWTGQTMTFCKGDYVDWTDPVNQDHLTPNVWLTRKDSEGLFNIAQESGYDRGVSPADTEWAYGSIANWGSLSYQDWGNWAYPPPNTVGQDTVLHLISDRIYLAIKFTQWTEGDGGGGGNGGGFCYERSTPDPDLIMAKTVTPNQAVPGQSITYTLTFSNVGAITATGVMITDVVASEQFSALGYQSAGARITETGSVSYTWQVEDLAPAAGGVITISGVLSDSLPSGIYTNLASISGATEEITSNNSSSASVLVSCPSRLVVDNLGDGDDGSYCSGENTLREAVTYAGTGDTITFDAGLTGGTIILGGTQLELTKTLNIEGNVPITVSGNNASRVFNIGSGALVTLTGLTIQDGNVVGNGGGIYNKGYLRLEDSQVVDNSAINGGGLYIESGSVVLTDTQVINNSADDEGGGLVVGQSSVVLNMVGGEIRDNSADRVGGGLVVYTGTAILSGTLVSDNLAEYGGGLYVNVGRAVLSGTLVSDNLAHEEGGGLYVDTGTAMLNNTLVLSNLARYGGGLYVYRGSAMLTDTQVVSNSAGVFGGGLYVSQNRAVLSIHGGQVRDNAAPYHDGGGLYVNRGRALLDSTLVSGNSADWGGGVFVYWGSAALTDTQVISNSANNGGGLYVALGNAVLTMVDGEVGDNSATDRGGGLYVSVGSAVLSDTQVHDNSANDGDAVYNYGGTITSGSALTLNGEVYQADGTFAGSSYDLSLDGALVLAGGYFYAPSHFSLSGPFTHTAGSYHQTQVVTDSQDIGFPKAGGLILNANGLDLGGTAVTITAGADCAGVMPGEAVQHCYVISPTHTGGRDTTLTLFYRDSELPTDHYCSAMEAYRWSGAWDTPLTRDATYGNMGRLCGPEPQSIRVTGVTEFSPFVLRGSAVDLHIDKVVTPMQAVPGEAITYTLSFSNVGTLIATGVVITDSIPVSVTGTSVISSGVAITQRVGTRYVWDVADLAFGAGGIITVTGTLSQPLTAGDFTNTATIATSDSDGNPDNNESSAGVTVPNVAPVADDDSFNVTQYSADNILGILNDDVDANGDKLNVHTVGTPDQSGTALNVGTHITYTPVTNFNGTETFTYTVSDGHGGYDTATVVVTVTLVNDTTPPTFTVSPLITPTNGMVLTNTRPPFDWKDAVDDLSGVVSYTLHISSSNDGLKVQESSDTVTTTTSGFTPTVDLDNGVYTWTVKAHDAAGNVSNYVTPALTFTLSADSSTTFVYLPIVVKNN